LSDSQNPDGGFCCDDLASLPPDPAADEVAAVAAPRGSWVAWSGASLEHETVTLARLEPQGRLRRQGSWSGFRPSLAWLDGGPALAFCRRAGERVEAALWIAGQGEPRALPAGGDVFRCNLAAAAGGGLWLAWTEGAGPETRIAVGLQDAAGRLRRLARVPGEQPALASRGGEVRLAWVRVPEGLSVAEVTPDGVGPAQSVAAGPGPGAPCLDRDPRGRWWVAWHAPLGDGVLRWLLLARQQGDGWQVLGPPVAGGALEAAGEDQGWEQPALLAGDDGTLWLAGRSSGGFHVQARLPGGWTVRHDVSGPGWSNRSLSCSLLQRTGRVQLARGTPGGIVVSALAPGPPGPRAPDLQAPPPAAAPAPPRHRPPSGWPRVLFGDLHQHSLHSDGTGSAEEAFCRARDELGHDFAALTDHEKLGTRCLGPETWRYQCQVADAFDRPGAFVTLRAYEFTGSRLPGPGHKCVYFGDSLPQRLPPKELSALLPLLREHRAIAVPHHVGWTGADLEHHDPELQPVWEICSAHGSYERHGDPLIPPRDDVVLEGQFIHDALQAGLVFGFVGGTDSHGLRWHHGVCRMADPYRSGLAAVFAEHTREALLSALRARRCYATSGARIHLWVELDGAPMGSRVPDPRGELLIRVCGTAPLDELRVVQDGRPVWTHGDPDPHQEHALQLRLTGSASHVYVRVVQRDGHAAWSSPCWMLPGTPELR
jgi:hypothetical protein